LFVSFLSNLTKNVFRHVRGDRARFQVLLNGKPKIASPFIFAAVEASVA